MKEIRSTHLTKISGGNKEYASQPNDKSGISWTTDLAMISTSGMIGTIVGSAIGLALSTSYPSRGDYTSISNAVSRLLGVVVGGTVGMLSGTTLGGVMATSNEISKHLP